MQTETLLSRDYTSDVFTFNTPCSKKLYTKQIRPDGNIEYTVKYETFVLTPNFTKILVGSNNEILAYIDVQRIPRPFESQFKDWKWFGIQEFHPELIGDFTHTILNRKNDIFYVWKHQTNDHLYILDTSRLARREDWYCVKTDPLNNGTIETNFGILDGSTRSYRYYTHPSVPTNRIENLKKEILIEEGIIKPQLNFTQKIKTFFQKRK